MWQIAIPNRTVTADAFLTDIGCAAFWDFLQKTKSHKLNICGYGEIGKHA